MFDMIGGALVGELVGIGHKKLAKLFEDEPLRKAWSDACKNIVESYTADAMARGGSDSFQPPALERQMNEYAQSISLPGPDKILSMLLEGWRERKQALSGSQASPFFAAEEGEVTPVLTTLANRFFIEVAQIPKYRDPLLVLVALQTSSSSPSSAGGASMVDEYVRTFAEAATRPSGPQPDQARFPLNCSLAGEAAEFPVEKLFDRVRNFRYVFLMGPAGGGKTEALNRLISALLADLTAAPNILPVLVDAARVSGLADQFLQFYNGQDELFPSVWNRFLSEALVPISVKTLDDMGQDAVPFLIIDQLNEVPSYEVAKAILKLAREFVRRRTPKNTYVIVAGRRAPSDLWTDWRVIELHPLAQAVKEEQIDRGCGSGTYSSLPPNAKDLLSLPYYLRLALDSGSPANATDADAIRGFLCGRLGLNDSDLNKLAEAAFNAYRLDGSTLFGRETFEQILGTRADDIVSSAIIEKADAKRIRFVHQLHHDYLASRHLACTKDWGAASFDAVSLRANSFDSLRMVVQQIGNVSDGDQFLRALYDWNLTAAAIALIESHKLAVTHFSTDVEAALLALMAQKAVDPVEDTRNRFKGLTGGLSTDLANSLLAARDEDSVLEAVKAVAIGSPWFIRWRAMFTAAAPLDEDGIAEIESPDSIVGWTVSNAVRRTGAAASERQLRQSYRSNLPRGGPQMNKGRHADRTPDEAFHDTVRWRVVHALGTTPSQENAKVLLSALDKDPYHWTRYGAARSLVEMAAITADASIRSFILAELEKRAAELVAQKGQSRHIVEEIGRAMDHRNAVGEWHTEILRLVELFCSVQDEEVSTVWKSRRERRLSAAASAPGTRT